MASPIGLVEQVRDVTECGICLELMSDPMMLPCVHTFCSNCLEKLWTGEKDGSMVPCPVCRSEIAIPEGGVGALRKNILIAKLLDSLRNFDNQKLRRGNKDVRYDGCGAHRGRRVDLYCVQCRTTVCDECLTNEHANHSYTGVGDIAGELKSQIRVDLRAVDEVQWEIIDQLKLFDKISANLKQTVKKTEFEIRKKGSEIKRLIDEHLEEMIEKLNSECQTKVDKIEQVKQDLLVQCVDVDNFRSRIANVLDNSLPTDVIRAADGLKRTAKKIARLKIIRFDKPAEVLYSPPDVVFGAAKNMKDLEGIIGVVSVTDNNFSSRSLKSESYENNPTKVCSLTFNNSVRGMTRLDDKLYVVTKESPNIKVYNSETFCFEMCVFLTGLRNPWDITAAKKALFVTDFKDVIYRVQLLPKQSISSWTVPEGSSENTISTTSRGDILVTCCSINKLLEYSSTGKLQRQISLPPDMAGPVYAMHFQNDQFLVSHTSESSHRVCLIDNTGHVLKSYGEKWGHGFGQLSHPSRFVVDQSNCILVADFSNKRIVLLDSNLEFVKYITPASNIFGFVFAIYLDEDEARLYVTDYQKKKLEILQWA